MPEHVTEHSLSGAAHPRFLDVARDAIRQRHYSYRTEETCLHRMKRFILFSGKRHPLELGEVEVAAFLDNPMQQRQVAAATQNQALAALLFLNEPPNPRRLERVSADTRGTISCSSRRSRGVPSPRARQSST